MDATKPSGVRRWVAWRLIDGRKPPVGDDGLPLKNWADPESWLSVQEARARAALVLEAHPKDQSGIGFVLGDGWSGIDLDHCRDVQTGALDPRAQSVLDAYPTAYAEVSPSGEGVKMFGQGDGWLELNFVDPLKIGTERKASGYFTVTRLALSAARRDFPPLDLDAIVAALTGARASAPGAGRLKPLPQGQPVTPGGQENAMFREACALRQRNYSEEEITEALWILVQQGRFPNEPGREPWTKDDCREKARSAGRYAAGPPPGTQVSTSPHDTAAAEYFAQRHGSKVRFDHRRKRWLIYDGLRWKPDDTEEVVRLQLQCAKERIQACSEPKEAKALVNGLNRHKIDDALDLARAQLEIASSGVEWDTDPWLLGVQNGVLDLHTGQLRDAKPEDRITMQCAASFVEDAHSPLWEAIVADVFKDNPELIAYFQRAIGYALTGDCHEEVFFLLHGEGRNGKGTLINTLEHMLGDYATNLAFHSLEASQYGDKTSNDLAKLTHKRFVTASETKGRRFNEARIKMMTGRDSITARFLYAEEFSFIPEFKLFLSVNELPRVNDESAGFWSRPHRIPFLQCYEGREDKTLKDRLLSELEGILAWAVRGCLAWQASGLRAPQCVTRAVEEYKAQQEPLAEWLDARCVLTEAKTPVAQLRDDYLRWADHERPFRRLSHKEFGQALGRRFKRVSLPHNSGVAYLGVGLKDSRPWESM